MNIIVKFPSLILQQFNNTSALSNEVINTIRECAATIEKFGFIIDTEEIDLEDNYQVTFKIEKR